MVSGVILIHFGSPQLRSRALDSRYCHHCKDPLIGTLVFRGDVFTPLQHAFTQVVMPLNEFRVLCVLAVMRPSCAPTIGACRLHIRPYWKGGRDRRFSF
jgi:hypothetical protein